MLSHHNAVTVTMSLSTSQAIMMINFLTLKGEGGLFLKCSSEPDIVLTTYHPYKKWPVKVGTISDMPSLAPNLHAVMRLFLQGKGNLDYDQLFMPDM